MRNHRDTRRPADRLLNGHLSRRNALKGAAALGFSAPFATTRTRAAQDDGGIYAGELIVVLNNAGVGSLDPARSRHTKAGVYQRHLLDQLVRVDPVTGEIVPNLAEAWTVSDDGTTYTFTLRDDVTFHDGTPFNAEAVKFNFDRINELQAADAWNAIGGSRYGGTTAVDEFTAELQLTEPIGAFLSSMTVGISSPAAIEEYGDAYGTVALVGTGPFTLVEWVEEDHITMDRNPDYAWAPPIYQNEGPPRYERLVIRGLEEPGARVAAMEAGEADFVMLDAGDVPQFEGRSDVLVQIEPKAGTTRLVTFNVEREFLQDERVRQAFSAAINRESLLQAPRYAGVGSVAYSVLGSKNLQGNLPDELVASNYLYDPESANAVLDEAGWTVGEDGIRTKDDQRLSLLCVIPEHFLSEFEPIQAMIQEIGFETNYELVTTNAWFDALDQGLFDVTIQSNSGAGLDLVYQWFHTDGTANRGNYSAPDVDDMLETFLQTDDFAERLQLAIDVQEIVIGQGVVVPTIDEVYPFVMKPDISGVFYPEESWPIFYDVVIDR